MQAPFTLHRQVMRQIDSVTQAARAGKPARIVAKINALTDVPIIEALVAAAHAGARIDLIVRGACMLPPVHGIRVVSVVGRLLEHSRVLYFRWGDTDQDEMLLLSSADWMGRNMFRRIEIAWPVRDVKMRQRVIDECLVPYLHDRKDAWELQADGSYLRLGTDGPSAQQALLAKHSGSG
jgi:polyphosphate kinase